MGKLRPSDYSKSTWTNGGGTTAQIAVFPAAAGRDDVIWRISMASVEPWTLEQAPMPRYPSTTIVPWEDGMAGMSMSRTAAANRDTIAATAREIGVDGQFRIKLPADETGVFTISSDSNSGDIANPFGDRTVHIDQYSGDLITEVAFADYGVGGKAMAAGIALHQGNLGWWNVALNLLLCAAIAFIAVSGS